MKLIFKNKFIKRAILSIICIGSIYALFVYILIVSAYREVPPENIGVIIVLGAQVKGEEIGYPTKTLEERLDAAYEYLVDNEETIVVVAGGKGDNEPEAEGIVMARYLIDKGIAEDRVIIEDTSTSTIENIANAGKLTDISEAIIVTSDYHVYRAMRTAKQNGVTTVYGLAAPSGNMSTFLSYVREILALGYHLIFTH